jgi:hypothetical protein
MDLQKRAQEVALSELVGNMSPTAIFNRFDLSASNGQHCGEYRVIYHDSCERAVETAEFADVLPCKKSSIRLRSLERPPAIVLIEMTRAVLTTPQQFANNTQC